MEKTIYIKPYNSPKFYKNGIFNVHPLDNIFYEMDKFMKVKYNVELKTSDYIENDKPATIIYCDLPYPWDFKNWILIFKNLGHNYLLCFESPLVMPFSHRKIFFNLFKKVYTWNENLVDNNKIFKMNIPQTDNGLNTSEVEFNKKKDLVLVNSNKGIPFIFKLISPFRTDLYLERLKLIDYMETETRLDFELYGHGWNEKRRFNLRDFIFGAKHYRNFKSPTDEKVNVISRYKFCISLENCAAPGYITEKIFDCFKAKTVPIYWKTDTLSKHIPDNTYINYREFSTQAELIDYLVTMPEEKYKEYIHNAQKFLADPTTQKKWFKSAFADILVKMEG